MAFKHWLKAWILTRMYGKQRAQTLIAVDALYNALQKHNNFTDADAELSTELLRYMRDTTGRYML